MKTTLNNIITREIQVRALTDDLVENRQAEFVISTEAVDTYGTVFKMDGWNLNRFNNNPVVLYGHRSHDGNPDFIIGTGEVYREDDKLIGRVTFEPEEDNPLAEKVYRKVKRGTIRMASIGADPKEGSFGKKETGENPEVFYFRNQDLLEFSLVPIGSNPEALKRNAQAIEDFKKEIVRDIEVTPEPETPAAAPDDKQLLSIREAQLLIHKSKNVQK